MRLFDRNTIFHTHIYIYIHVPLLPRIKQSPYLACNCPVVEYSSVCSMAIFKYPSKLPNTPRYSIPEFNFTRIGRPNIDFKKSDGVFDFLAAAVVALVIVGSDVESSVVSAVATAFGTDDASLVVDMMDTN